MCIYMCVCFFLGVGRNATGPRFTSSRTRTFIGVLDAKRVEAVAAVAGLGKKDCLMLLER